MTTVAVWGVTLVSTKILLAEMSTMEIITYRFLISYLCLAVIYPKKFGIAPWKEELLFAILGFTGLTVYFLLENQALNYTLVANVGIFAACVPIMTAALARMFKQEEKLGSEFKSGLIIALVGAVAVITNGDMNFRVNVVGDLMAIAACLSFAVYSLLIRRINRRVSVFYITRKMFFYGLLFTIPTALLSGVKFEPKNLADPVVGLNILFLGVIASCACYIMWNKAVGLIGAVKSGNYIYLIPVINIVTAVLILGDEMSLTIGLGCALTVLGVYISENGFKMPMRI